MASQSTGENRKSSHKGLNDDTVFAHVQSALEGLQFGTVTIIVQNGRVVQIDRSEKTRLTNEG